MPHSLLVLLERILADVWIYKKWHCVNAILNETTAERSRPLSFFSFDTGFVGFSVPPDSNFLDRKAHAELDDSTLDVSPQCFPSFLRRLFL